MDIEESGFEYPVKVAEYTTSYTEPTEFPQNCCISLIKYYGRYISVATGYYDGHPDKEYASINEGRAAVTDFTLKVTEDLYGADDLKVIELTDTEAHIQFTCNTGVKLAGKLWWLDYAPETVKGLKSIISIIEAELASFKKFGNPGIQGCCDTEPRTW